MAELSPEELQPYVSALIRKLTDCLIPPPAAGQSVEVNRAVTLGSLANVMAIAIANAPQRELTLGAVMRLIQEMTSDFAQEDIQPMCDCPACQIERMLGNAERRGMH